MQLVERGLLSIDQPVRELIPEFAGPGKENITLRHFLTHTSGLPEYAEDNEEIRRQQRGLDAFVRSYCRGRLLFPPGSQWSYSNYGFGLAGEIVARFGGRGYHEFVAEEILAPLGMRDSYLQPPAVGLGPDRLGLASRRAAHRSRALQLALLPEARAFRGAVSTRRRRTWRSSRRRFSRAALIRDVGSSARRRRAR